MKSNFFSTNGYEPLLEEVHSGRVHVARRMLDDGYNKRMTDSHNNTLLHLARDSSMVMMLIAQGCALESKNDEGHTPLQSAVIVGNTANAQRLIESGANKRIIDEDGNGLLHLASDSPMITMLVSQKCGLERKNHAGYTPLQHAVVESRLAAAKALIERGADKDVIDGGWQSLMHLARDPAMVLMLASKRCAMEKQGASGHTPLQSAVISNHVAVAQALIGCGADKNVIDSDGDSLMHLAGSPAMVKMLLENECSFDVKNKQQQTPLEQTESAAVRKILIAASKDVTDEKGETLLHRAVRANDMPQVEMLIKAGYDINLENKNDDSPLTIAVDKRFKDMEQRLRMHGASTYEAVIPKTMLVRDYRRQEKAAIIAKGGLSPLAEGGALPTVAQVIESNWFLGDAENRDAFKGQAAALYQEPLLRPMMQVMALAGLGKHDAGINNPAKHFKIIGVNEANIRPLRVTSRSVGLFTNQNSGFAALAKQTRESVLGTIFHESMHFVMNEVFKNDCNPYKQNDSYHKRVAGNVEQAIQDRLDTMQKEKPHEKIAFSAISRVFRSSYEKSDYTNELIARVPDIIAEIGARDGVAWLMQNVPELVEFCKSHVNPAINEYLKAHRISEFVDIRSREEKKHRTKRHRFIDIAGDSDVTDEKDGKKSRKEALPASGTPQLGFVQKLVLERATRQTSSAMEGVTSF